jgi:hypothetical protein
MGDSYNIFFWNSSSTAKNALNLQLEWTFVQKFCGEHSRKGVWKVNSELNDSDVSLVTYLTMCFNHIKLHNLNLQSMLNLK